MKRKADCYQSVNGILLLNKPQGISSNGALQRLKRLYQAKKAGHTGSLDPLATGMLPICFGEATKFSQYLLDADKTYTASACLGIKTDTGDALGCVLEEASCVNVSTVQLMKAIETFRGKIEQVPPMFSALKHQGVPLYRYARKGMVLDRAVRKIEIYQLELKRFNDNQFDILVSCSKGTYIRTLVEDIGDALGVGAHVTALHRVHTAGLDGEKTFTFAELENMSPDERLSALLPVDRAVMHLPAISLTNAEVDRLRFGREIDWDDATMNTRGLFRLYDVSEHYVGLGEMLPCAKLVVKRLLAQQQEG